MGVDTIRICQETRRKPRIHGGKEVGQDEFAVGSEIHREGRLSHHRDFIKETTKLSLQKFTPIWRHCKAPRWG